MLSRFILHFINVDQNRKCSLKFLINFRSSITCRKTEKTISESITKSTIYHSICTKITHENDFTSNSKILSLKWTLEVLKILNNWWYVVSILKKWKIIKFFKNIFLLYGTAFYALNLRGEYTFFVACSNAFFSNVCKVFFHVYCVLIFLSFHLNNSLLFCNSGISGSN